MFVGGGGGGVVERDRGLAFPPGRVAAFNGRAVSGQKVKRKVSFCVMSLIRYDSQKSPRGNGHQATFDAAWGVGCGTGMRSGCAGAASQRVTYGRLPLSAASRGRDAPGFGSWPRQLSKPGFHRKPVSCFTRRRSVRNFFVGPADWRRCRHLLRPRSGSRWRSTDNVNGRLCRQAAPSTLAEVIDAVG